MDQISGTTTPDAPAQPAQQAQPAQEPPAGAAPINEPGSFRSRGSARRRARFLRRARELGYRDLGGLVFNLHRFGQRNDALVLAKLTTLGHIDTELRALEGVLGERRPVTILREAGITACPRCAAIHSSEDNFCPNCGFSISHQADLPLAAPAPVSMPASAHAPLPTQQPPSPSPSSAPAAPSTPPSDEDGPTEIISPPVSGS
ncbi:MAG TPA: zinc ribbon domain-containing protein [Solirubrobacteraceae bacterium]